MFWAFMKHIILSSALALAGAFSLTLQVYTGYTMSTGTEV